MPAGVWPLAALAADIQVSNSAGIGELYEVPRDLPHPSGVPVHAMRVSLRLSTTKEVRHVEFEVPGRFQHFYFQSPTGCAVRRQPLDVCIADDGTIWAWTKENT